MLLGEGVSSNFQLHGWYLISVSEFLRLDVSDSSVVLCLGSGICVGPGKGTEC